eukprot:CAMPEP_0118669558 /NCGR_PEP_ID=MMETSP0785-20121206/20969_1 /TAXON_ID=91992 /ORGANISM="Bolidomonas pacifica, Strain CCMP 1866" /LENGTH=169 /DNA_ID=CAMNT_0006564257 /DNA_START=46 /DNA_END=555 /DNA_ORIENTATION=+
MTIPPLSPSTFVTLLDARFKFVRKGQFSKATDPMTPQEEASSSRTFAPTFGKDDRPLFLERLTFIKFPQFMSKPSKLVRAFELTSKSFKFAIPDATVKHVTWFPCKYKAVSVSPHPSILSCPFRALNERSRINRFGEDREWKGKLEIPQRLKRSFFTLEKDSITPSSTC